MVMLATVCVEGVIQLSAQSGLVIVVNLLIAAVVAAIIVFLLKGHSQILLQRRSEESIKLIFQRMFNVPTNMQQYVLASGDHEYGVIIDLTSESDDLSANQKELEGAHGSPAPIRGYNQ